MNYKEFAQSLKEKYPVYSDRDDRELAEAVIAKYPVYAEKVTFDDKNVFQNYSESVNDVSKNVSAYGFEGISRAAGAVTDLTGRAVSAASKGGGQVGNFIYRGIGNLGKIGGNNTGWEKAWDKVGQNFLENQYQFADRYKKEAMGISSFLADAGENARETILKTDKEAYANLEKKREERAQAIARGESDFKWSDMTEADFWVHDMFGGLLQNAPTMALSIYGGAQVKAAGALGYLAKAGASTAFSTGLNASIEAESAYSAALEEGKSEEEALAEADRVFKRNSIANSVPELIQMGMLFSPIGKVTSPWLKGLMRTGAIVGAGALEAGQERIEDNIQDQASNEDFDWNSLTESVTRAGVSRTDVVSFLMGMMFQGAGNVFVQQSDVEKAAQEQVKKIAEILPDDGEGGTPEQRVERAGENDPDALAAAVEQFNQEIVQVSDAGRQAAVRERLTDFAQEAIDGGRSPQEVVVALSGQIPTADARAIVDNIQPRKKAVAALPTPKELLETSPTKLQESLNSLETNFNETRTELNQKIDQLKTEVQEAPRNSQAKIGKKKELEQTRSQLRRAEKEYKAQIEDGGIAARQSIERYLAQTSDLSRAEANVITDRVLEKTFRTKVDVPLSEVIKNELRRFSPATRARRDQIEKAAAEVVKDKRKQDQMVNEAMDILQDPNFEAVTADMTIEQVISEMAKRDGLFQTTKRVKKKKPTYQNGERVNGNQDVVDAYGKDFLNFNMEYLVNLAEQKDFNLFAALVEKVDSETNVTKKVEAMNDIIADMVGRQNKNLSLFQTRARIKNVSRKPTGKAKIKNIKDDDLRLLIDWVDRVRANEDFSAKLDAEMRRLAERYGVKTEQSIKQIALAWERLFDRNKLDERIDGLVQSAIQEKKSIEKAKNDVLSKSDLASLKEDVKSAALEADLDIQVVRLEQYGSTVKGTQKANSDIDVYVEYKGDVKESNVFNILNDYVQENNIEINGRNIDFNPVRKEESGTILENKKNDPTSEIPVKKEIVKTKSDPADVKKQLQGLPFMKNVPVRMLDRISTPDGQAAFGRFINGMVQYTRDYDVTTIPHESFHVVTQIALTPRERDALYAIAREAYADPEMTTNFAIEEQLAQDFAEWYVTEKNPANFNDRLIGYFRKIKDFILDMVRPQNSKKLREIFEGVFDPAIEARINDVKTSKKRTGFYQMRNFDPSKKLLSVHNLSAENLLKADEIGGLANPSVAILDPDIFQLSGFGDITLIGDSQLVTSGKAKTYAADAYSPRFPSTENTYSYDKSEQFKKDNGIDSWDFDIEKFGYEAHRSRKLKELYLKKTGKLPKDWVRESYEDSVKMNELIQKNEEDFNNFLTGVRKEIEADNDRIFFGFTAAGSRRYKPLTAENASKYMNAQDGEGMFYGLGSLRASVVPNINTVKKIKKSQDKLVSKEEFEKIKEEMSAEMETLMDEISRHGEDRSRGFFDIAEHIRDYYKNGREIFTEPYGYAYMPEEVFEKLDAFRTKLENMPTEYFETKFKRVVNLGEFKAAVVPDNVPKRVIATLERYGIDVTTYKNEDAGTVDSERKSEENRAKAIKNAATNRDETLFFQRKKQVDPLYDMNEDSATYWLGELASKHDSFTSFEKAVQDKLMLHGGAKDLKGGKLKTGMGAGGQDAGGIFFAENTPDGINYARGYTLKHKGGVIHTAMLSPAARIFDFTNKDHRKLLQDNISKEEFDMYASVAGKGQIDWAQIPDTDMLQELGFDGMKVRERGAGFDMLYGEDWKQTTAKEDVNAIQVWNETMFDMFPAEINLKKLYQASKTDSGVQPEQAFQDFTDLTVKNLKLLEGKTTVSKQFILDTSNRPELKKPERDMIRKVLEDFDGTKIKVQDYANAIKAQLLPLEIGVRFDESASYQGIALPDDERGDVVNYEEHIYESPIKNTAGNVHFSQGGQTPKGYFAHVRIDDMMNGVTRRILELQSDLFQKGRLKLEMQDSFVFENWLSDTEAQRVAQINKKLSDIRNAENKNSYKNEVKELNAELSKLEKKGEKAMQKGNVLRGKQREQLEPYRNTWWKRIVAEEVRKAAEDGRTNIQFPTGETAMKIEGLGSNDIDFRIDGTLVQVEDIKVGDVGEFWREYDSGDVTYVITKVLGGGKLQVVQKRYQDLQPSNWKIQLEDMDGNVYPESKQKTGLLWVARNELTGDMKTQTFAPEKQQEAKEFLIKEKIGTKDKSLTELGERYGETFDLSGEIDTTNPIYRFYDKDIREYLNKNYDVEEITDAQGVTWLDFEIEPDVANEPVVAFYQRKDQVKGDYSLEPQESSIYQELHGEMERILFEVETLFELSEAGYRLVKDHDAVKNDSPIIAVESTFPKWIPSHLRSRKLMDTVLQQYLNGEQPKGSRQQELLEVIDDYVMSQLRPELQDAAFLADYAAEQQKVADDLRRDALDMLYRFAEKIGQRQAKLKKSDVKKVIRTNTGQIRTDTRAFSQKMKQRALYFNRGYKKGYKQGASDKFQEMLKKRKVKRVRNARIEKVKSIYRRVRQATRTGAYLPIEYQQRLTDLFDGFDMQKMTASTQKKLSDMAVYFANQEGEVPKDVARKLERLSKFAIGDMTDRQLEEFVTEVSRIYEQGVLKKKLIDARDEKKFAERVQTVAAEYTPSGRSSINLATYDPTRFADMISGGTGRYQSETNKMVDDMRVAMDESDQQSNALLAESLEEIAEFGNEFTDEEMARIVHQSALDQGGVDQAEALQMQYEDFDFKTPLTKKERGALDIMVETFKEIRPEVAATYEAINNIPFPDNDNYFPFRYDNEIEKFDIDDADFFDFKPTKTPQGFTMTRQDGVKRVLDINVFRTFATQVQSQIYYAKVQPQLNVAKDVVNAKPYQAKLTTAEFNYWKQFFADVASRGRRGGGRTSDKLEMQKDSWRSHMVNSFADPATIRQNINTAILGYKLSTVLIQPTALFDGMMNIRKQFGTVAALKVLPRFMRMMFNPNAVALAQERSVALANRAGGQIELKEMQDAQGGQFSPSKWRKGYRAWQKYAFAGIKYTDVRTAGAVFSVLEGEFKKKGLSAEQAVREAEKQMALSQSSANIANRPQALNAEAMRFILPFQTFVFNAFNNARYDAVSTELNTRGNVKGTLHAMLNLQFLVYAVAAEAGLRELYGKIFGYEDEEDETFFGKWFVSALGRLPFTSYFITYMGEFDGKLNFSESIPFVQSVERILVAASDLGEGKADVKDAYNAARGVLTLLGVGGTQQLHQILTAPDILGLGSIGMDLGIAYDDRTLQEKRSEAVQEYLVAGEPVTNETIETLARSIYGANYEEKGVDYRAAKNEEVVREIAIRQEFGFDDEFVNINLSKKTNNEVKAYYAQNPVDLDQYRKPVKLFGVNNTLMSSTLYKELKAIESAPAAHRTKISALATAETDEERLEAIAGDKNFAKLAFSKYKLISKEFYDSI